MTRRTAAKWLAVAALAAAAAGTAAPASARTDELVIAIAAPLSALDPHFHNVTPNNSLTKHVFENLVTTDAAQNPKPGLAESWRALDDRTWEIRLRKGVKFHDGSPFTAEDVLATFKRVPAVPNSPASFTLFVKPIVSATATDPHTLILKTAQPNPNLPRDLSAVQIIPKSLVDAKTEDFNSGKAMIGTGPYRFVEYKPGDRVILARNDAWWGGRTPWPRVQFRMISNNAARVAALLSGDVQVIENVPTADMERVKGSAQLSTQGAVSNRLIYLHMDTGRERNSPFIRTRDGKPMEANPLRDVRVRRAISKAINRDAIVERVMEKQAVPAGQLLADVFFGTSRNLPPEKFDPEGARKLLAEAGYPNGFQITLHAPNNRYVNDEKIAQAIAQLLTRVGIETRLETMPSNVFFSRGSKLEFSFLLAGWASESGDTSSPLRALLGTFDPAQGLGAANRGRFSDAGLDAMITTAVTQVDDTKRRMLLAAASEKAVSLMGIVPIHYEVSVWGMRRDVTYAARADQYTFAWEMKPAR